MSYTALVQNGKVVDNSAEASSASSKKSKAEEKNKSGLGKEAFLQLLVAQMQYQDPLEPMDNTEYISQLATFSQLEATQNLADTVSYGMANDLVGKYVILNTELGTVSGKVDYVMYENGNVYLAVDDGLYSLEDLDTVTDSSYYEAFQISQVFSAMIAKLPPVGNVVAGDAKSIEDARAVYDAMTDYQKGFVNQEDLKKLEELEKKIKELTGKPEEKPDDDKTDEVDPDAPEKDEGDKK